MLLTDRFTRCSLSPCYNLRCVEMTEMTNISSQIYIFFYMFVVFLSFKLFRRTKPRLWMSFYPFSVPCGMLVKLLPVIT